MATLTEFCGLPPDALQKYLKDPSSITMSQPDNHSSLQLSALTDANNILRDELFKAQAELTRQDAAYTALVKLLREKSADKDATAIRAAIYTEVAQLVEDALTGAQGGGV